MKNIKAAKVLVNKYQNIIDSDLEKILSDYYPDEKIDNEIIRQYMKQITGFGCASCCALCKNAKELHINSVLVHFCQCCIYTDDYDEDGEVSPCQNDIFYMIRNADSIPKLKLALKLRIQLINGLIIKFENEQ